VSRIEENGKRLRRPKLSTKGRSVLGRRRRRNTALFHCL
jgi:hypothetical protein